MGAMSRMMQTDGSLSAATKLFIGCELKRREEFFTPLHGIVNLLPADMSHWQEGARPPESWP
jgi:hypothetical protein